MSHLIDAFVESLGKTPWKPVTGFVAGWLGFQLPEAFELAELLYAVNQRLSSFGITVT